MDNNQDNKLVKQLHKEFENLSIRTRYVGNRKPIAKAEGFYWISKAMGRTLFKAKDAPFTLDDIYIVHQSNLVKV